MPSDVEAREKTGELSEADSKRHQFIKELAQKVREDDDDRSVWKDKQVVASNQRLGIKKRTNRMWKGWADVPIPLTDKLIRKMKTAYVSVATQTKNPIIVTVEENGEAVPTEFKQSAMRVQKALAGLIRKRDFKWVKKVTLFVDYFLENGIALWKVIDKFFHEERTETLNLLNFSEEEREEIKAMDNEALQLAIALRANFDLEDKADLATVKDIVSQIRAGEDEINYTREVVWSEPTAIPERGLRVIVPSSATDVQTLPRITHDMWMTLEELKHKADQGVYDKKVVDQLTDSDGIQDDSLNNLMWALNEGINREAGNAALFNVRECETWYEGSKWVFVWLEEGGHAKEKGGDVDIRVLQEIEYPYGHGKWSWIKHDAEVKNTRWHASRGVPETIRGLQQVMDKSYNLRIARDEINNASIYRVSPQLGYTGNEIQHRPGEFVEAEAGQIEQLNKPITVDVSTERLEQQAKAYAEEYLGIPDFTLKSANSQGGARTLGEIRTANQLAEKQIGLEVSMFLETLSEVAQHMYMLLKDSVQVPTVIGGVLLTPEDFIPQYNIAWVGSLEALDHQRRMNQALTRLDIINRVAVPHGVSTQEDVYNAVRDVFDKDPDVDNPDDYVTKPQEVVVDEVAKQQNEILRMKEGFDVQVMPDDSDAVHIQVIENYLANPANTEILNQNPMFAERLRVHANVHIQSEQQKLGASANGRTKQIAQKIAQGE